MPPRPWNSLVLAALLALGCSCAPRGGSSDECGPVLPVPEMVLIKLNDQAAPTGLDLPVQRTAGSSLEVTLEFSIARRQDWCMRGYTGPLTLTLQNLPASISKVFDPAVLPANVNPAVPQVSRLVLGIPASVPDGAVPILPGALESPLRSPAYRLVLTTKP